MVFGVEEVLVGAVAFWAVVVVAEPVAAPLAPPAPVAPALGLALVEVPAPVTPAEAGFGLAEGLSLLSVADTPCAPVPVPAQVPTPAPDAVFSFRSFSSWALLACCSLTHSEV